MSHTEQDLDNLISEHLENQIKCGDRPFICGLLKSQLGKARLHRAIKSMILVQGNTSISDCLDQIEHSNELED